MKIDRKQLIASHNPVLTAFDELSPLTVGNGELAFTADITGMQTLYQEYEKVPLCTMSQWGWHTTPVSSDRYAYTLKDLQMTEYEHNGRTVVYPKKKKPGNEEVYDWLRMNPHRLNLLKAGLIQEEKEITASRIKNCRQELHLYEGILKSSFTLDETPYHVTTACDNLGRDVLAFRIESEKLTEENTRVKLEFPYGSPKISASDWACPEKHQTMVLRQTENSVLLERTLDRDHYQVLVTSDGQIEVSEHSHSLTITPVKNVLNLTVALGTNVSGQGLSVEDVLSGSRKGWEQFWEQGGIIRLNQSKDQRARELERRIILSQYLMAVNSSGSTPPQETGLTCNSWYGKMHLEMYLWHCAWLPLWNHTDLLERSLAWYQEHLPQARENAQRNGYAGARWPKMIATEGIDCPSPVAPLLVWQQPHIIYMLETAWRQQKEDKAFLEKYWTLVEETAIFMVDFVVWNADKGCYEIQAPVIPAQECHKETETLNPAFEIEYWKFTLEIAIRWAQRLEKDVPDSWRHTASHMAALTEKDGLYLAHELCVNTFTEFNRDHPSMVGAYGLIDSDRIDREIMRNTLHKVLECWNYPTLWGWDFAMMAMTAVKLEEPELAIEILLKDTPKNCYLTNGNNMQISRADLPLYLPGNGSLLLAAAIMTAGYDGCKTKTPGFPDNGMWTVEYENILPFPSV